MSQQDRAKATGTIEIETGITLNFPNALLSCRRFQQL